MDAAETLFWSKDFDHTSTNDILNKVGTARGTLYYHFKSKEDILYAMIGRMTERLTATAAKIARDESVSVLERLSQTIIAMNVGENVGTEFIEQIHKPQKKTAFLDCSCYSTAGRGRNPAGDFPYGLFCAGGRDAYVVFQ